MQSAAKIVRAARPLARAVPATSRSMVGEPLGHKVPNYKYMRGVVEQTTSPFEVRQIDTLFANFGHKFKHETVDNFPDLFPAAFILGFTMWYTNYVNEKNEAKSRY